MTPSDIPDASPAFAGLPGSASEVSPLANAASAAAAKIVHHPRWPRMAAEAHSLATKIIVTEMETMLREAWKTPAVLRAHVLRYGPPGYDITHEGDSDRARLDWMGDESALWDRYDRVLAHWHEGIDFREAVTLAMSEPNDPRQTPTQ